MKLHITIPVILIVSFLLSPTPNARAQTQPPVVRAVLFYSPTCGHCEYVIQNTLLPLMEKYGDQLQIVGVDVTQEQGQALFHSAMQKFALEEAGVPFLVIEDTVLIGSVDIPDKFPGLVETRLAQGGTDWPEIPGLTEAINVSAEAGTATAAAAATPTMSPGILLNHTGTSATWLDLFFNDPAANILSVFVLVGMLGAIAWTVVLFLRTKDASLRRILGWDIPLLCLLGVGIAGYLAYVETTQATAVCGPVGDCNTVQQSEYARLFGILPIGVLGLIGYAFILVAFTFARIANRGWQADLATVSLFGMTVLGTLFSIYLTFLEPFVIGATCAWCLTSAIIMTALMLLSAKPARLAFRKLTRPRPVVPKRLRIRDYNED